MAQLAATYLHQICIDNGNYTTGSQFESNLQRLFIRTLYKNGGDNFFSNGTKGDDPDKVYGLFLCRGDVQPSMCQKCVDQASEEIVRRCPLYKEAILWYDECLIRYSNRSFFSTMETYPTFDMFNSESATQPDKLYEILEKTFSNLSIVATSNRLNHMYATSSVNELYSMVQCTPDLSPTDCRTCLNVTVSERLGHFKGREGGRVLTPSCNVRFEFYRFWLDSSVFALLLVIPRSLIMAQLVPTYRQQICIDTGNYTTGSQFESNLQCLFIRTLYNNGVDNFNNGIIGDDSDKVYGPYLCRGDVQPSMCQKCVDQAAKRL